MQVKINGWGVATVDIDPAEYKGAPIEEIERELESVFFETARLSPDPFEVAALAAAISRESSEQ